ncbi:MAG: hypothetical protein WA294_04510 [Acidobacteriaceae bacterium]
MQSTLQEHILRLEYRVQELSDRLTACCSAEEREPIVSELQTAKLALRLYREAFDAEQKLPRQRR